MPARVFRNLRLDEGLLLPYVHDLLTASPTGDKCVQNTIRTLNCLANCGYKASQKKAQICKEQVSRLCSLWRTAGVFGLIGSKQLQNWEHLWARRVRHDWSDLAAAAARPTANWEGFWKWQGSVGFRSQTTGSQRKPLYRALKGRDLEPLFGTKECQTVCETIKMLIKLLSTPALALPDFKKHFKLYIHER